MDNATIIIDEYKKRHDHMQIMLAQKRTNEDRLIKSNVELKKKNAGLVSRLANHRKTIERLRGEDIDEIKKENAKLKSCLTKQSKESPSLGEYEEYRLRQNYSNVKSSMKKLKEDCKEFTKVKKDLVLSKRVEQELKEFLQDLSSKKVAGIVKQIIDMKLNEVKLWK